jgi:hypothetical protein
MEDPRRKRQLVKKRKKKINSSPEDDPLWGLFGVWGRVLIVFANIGFLLFVGATILGWGMFKFVLHVFGLGLLLLFSRPNYSPFLSSIYCDSGMTKEEVDELRRMVLRKLTGQSSELPQAYYTAAVSRAAPPPPPPPPLPEMQPPPVQHRLQGTMGWFGRFLRRVVDGR